MKLRLFKIKKVIGKINYELELSQKMKIHPVFHVFLLKSASQNAKMTQVEIESDQKYKIQRILEKKVEKGQ